MNQAESQEILTSEEEKYRFYMTRGQEFLGIEIYRNARKYFQQAFDMNINNEQALSKLKETEKLIKTENNIFVKIAAGVLILGILIISTLLNLEF